MEAATAGDRDGAARGSAREFWTGLGRAFGGAMIFSLPLLMTMEMWWLGFYMDRGRLALFTALMVPLLIALDHYSGFKPTSTWREDVVDGIIAYGVGIVSSIVVLLLFDVVSIGMPLGESVGKVALQAIPASLGAVLAASQFGGANGGADSGELHEERRRHPGYWAELLLMLTGAVFLAFNVAPTEEMILIAFKMTTWHGLALALVSLAAMHAFVYAVEFHGSPGAPEGMSAWTVFLRFTVVGYAIALLVSAYVLWTFGRTDATAAGIVVLETVVLGFPAALGAAAARLIL